jgi:hypothetical protein
MIEQLLKEECFHFIHSNDKQFICNFTNNLESLGYTCNNKIGSGFCWGKYMIIYTKANVSSKKVVARIYIRENDIVLRLFFNNVSKHSAYIENIPDYMKDVFIGSYGTCVHCKGDHCKFRKDYTIDDVNYEKCNGKTFEFYRPNTSEMNDYIGLFKEFYKSKRV